MRKHSLHWVIIFISFVTAQSYRANAADVEWRGFFSTGTSFSDSNTPYLNGTNKKAQLSEETFLGLNLSKELDAEWRVAAQFVARAGQSDSALKADWAFVTYDPPNPFDVTLGKQKIPMWMMSAYLDVGRAYPWVIPPDEVYTLFNLRSFTGVAIGYTFQLGDSILVVRPYGGETIVEAAPSAPTNSSKIKGQNLAGASVEWTWGPLLLRSAFNRALWNLDLDPTLQYGERRYQILTHGIRVDKEGFLLLAEFASTKDLDEKKRLRLADGWAADAAAAANAGDNVTAAQLSALAFLNRIRIGGSEAYYLTLGQEIKNLFLHITYANLKKPIFDGTKGDQQSYALGANYDINVDSVIKAEARQISIPDDSQGLFRAKPESSTVMVYRLGYSLIF